MRAVTMRAAPTLESGGVRTMSVAAVTFSTFSGKMQELFEQSARSARVLFDDQLPNIFVAFLTPASMVALVLGLWRFTADAGWTGTFVIGSGFFSHWQVWIAVAVVLKCIASWGSVSRSGAPKISE